LLQVSRMLFRTLHRFLDKAFTFIGSTTSCPRKMDKLFTNPGPVTIAYADDHNSVRKSIMSYLHDLGGIEVIIDAANGKELIEQIENSAIKPDVCLVDIRMPELNGFETISAIRHKWKGMKTLVLSTYVEEMYVLRMIRAGVNGYLSKSCDPEEIKDAILSIHHKGNYFSPLFSESMAIAIQNKESKIPNFTEKELVFLKHCCSDMTYLQIAQVMKSTPKSIEGYRDSLFKKLRVNSRVSLALFAVRSGIVPIDSAPIQ
jgi:two-component system invasion response regulator UvrY